MLLTALLAASAAHAASLEAYSKPRSIPLVSVSPDGAKVAFVQLVNGKQAVVIDQLSPAAVIANIPPGNRFYEALTWVDSNHVIASGSAIQVVDLEKRKVTPLFESQVLFGTFGTPKVRVRDGRTTVFVGGYSGVDGGTAAAIWAVDFATGKAQRLARAHSNQSAEWEIDADGNLVSQLIYDQLSHVWTLQLRRGSDWIDVLSGKTLYDPPTIAGLTRDATGLVLEKITDDHGLEFRSLSLSDGKLGDLTPEYSGLISVVYDPLTHRPIGGVKEGMEPTYVFFDPKDQALWDGIAQVFPDEEVQLASWSRDRSKVAVLVTGPRHGVSYQLVDLVTHKATEIGQLYGNLTSNDLADVLIASYPAKDGLSIQALLTLPTGREPKNLPLIVLPHSGPSGRDQVGYNSWAQALASRGYAVLQPQFRGSRGLGWKLEAAGFGEWGRKMQTDLSDGVRALASKGYVDPKRVCIAGSGYGGYAALAGVMFEQGVYRCAVAIEPWTDLRELGGGSDADTKHSIAVRNWERFVGAKDPGDPIFDRISPSKHAADASAPILVMRMGGSGDDAVFMANALSRAKKPVELVRIDYAGPADAEAGSLKLLQAMTTFLEKNNPPQ